MLLLSTRLQKAQRSKKIQHHLGARHVESLYANLQKVNGIRESFQQIATWGNKSTEAIILHLKLIIELLNIKTYFSNNGEAAVLVLIVWYIWNFQSLLYFKEQKESLWTESNICAKPLNIQCFSGNCIQSVFINLNLKEWRIDKIKYFSLFIKCPTLMQGTVPHKLENYSSSFSKKLLNIQWFLCFSSKTSPEIFTSILTFFQFNLSI